jgi:hypothetical protein
MNENLIDKNPASPFETVVRKSNQASSSYTTRSFDPMHQYSVIFIVLSSGFWQYFIQGLMGQLALGPMSYSQYQSDLFWIQQCHLTIGAAHPATRHSFFLKKPMQALFWAEAPAMPTLCLSVCSVAG